MEVSETNKTNPWTCNYLWSLHARMFFQIISTQVYLYTMAYFLQADVVWLYDDRCENIICRYKNIYQISWS